MNDAVPGPGVCGSQYPSVLRPPSQPEGGSQPPSVPSIAFFP